MVGNIFLNYKKNISKKYKVQNSNSLILIGPGQGHVKFSFTKYVVQSCIHSNSF